MTARMRFALGTGLALLALNAFGGALYGLAGAKDIPKQWLAGSPFSDYFVPSLILLIAVGGSLAGAAIAVLAGWRTARPAAQTAGTILIGWIAIQVSIIGYVSWMQPAVALAGLAIVALSTARSLHKVNTDGAIRRGLV